MTGVTTRHLLGLDPWGSEVDQIHAEQEKTSRSVPHLSPPLFVSLCAPDLVSCSVAVPHVKCLPEVIRTKGQQQQACADDTLAGVWSPKAAEVDICSENSLELLGHEV